MIEKTKKWAEEHKTLCYMGIFALGFIGAGAAIGSTIATNKCNLLLITAKSIAETYKAGCMELESVQNSLGIKDGVQYGIVQAKISPSYLSDMVDMNGNKINIAPEVYQQYCSNPESFMSLVLVEK